MGIYSITRDADIIGWKKVFARVTNYPYDLRKFPVIAKLRIPKDAAVVFGFLKCRASRVIVDGFYTYDHVWEPSPDNELSLLEACSAIDPRFLYTKGSEAFPDYFDSDPTNRCSHGIHFFRTYEEAANYDFT